mmetsp:Transcript_27356/g.43816  ORF Transcript_27356/g.43816 Transcript_27356/m.43816 type:complete len:202 (+) Transcript_27356:202-807(+)
MTKVCLTSTAFISRSLPASPSASFFICFTCCCITASSLCLPIACVSRSSSATRILAITSCVLMISASNATGKITSRNCKPLMETCRPFSGFWKASCIVSNIRPVMSVRFVKNRSAVKPEHASTTAARANLTNSSLYKLCGSSLGPPPSSLYKFFRAEGSNFHWNDMETSISSPSADLAFIGCLLISPSCAPCCEEITKYMF